MLAHVIDALHQVAGVADVCLVQCTHVPASVAKFCSQPGCLADTNLTVSELQNLLNTCEREK